MTDSAAWVSRHLTCLALGGMVILVVFGFLITMTRTPAPSEDSQLYASIARSRQLYGIGVPSTHLSSPYAVDHVPFYGPVFFDLVAGSFTLLGVARSSVRLVCLLGALLLAGAGALLARSLSPSRDRWLWASTLLLLTPEIGTAATSGDLETTAVAFEMLALAVFVRGWVSGTRPHVYGACAGVFLLLAALTTPRTYPFLAGVLIAPVLLARMPFQERRIAWSQLAASAAVLLGGMGIWGTMSQGNPIRWLQYMFFILTREDTDVAVLPTATRMLVFNWTSAVTPCFAIAGAVVAGRALMRRDDRRTSRDHAARFALLAVSIASALTVIGMNYTFTLGTYFAVPLFAVVLALLDGHLSVMGRRTVAVATALVLMCDAGYVIKKYLRVAATWSSRDPERVRNFVGRYVPAGADVIGPDAPYFFAVERAGARYRSVSDRSVADWSRWVPIFDALATKAASRVHLPPPKARFLIWPAAEPFPDGYACARDRTVAVYVPPPNSLQQLGPLGHAWAGYPETTLYQLAPGCPTGYDPTRRVDGLSY